MTIQETSDLDLEGLLWCEKDEIFEVDELLHEAELLEAELSKDEVLEVLEVEIKKKVNYWLFS